MTKTRVGATICISDLENSEYAASLCKLMEGPKPHGHPGVAGLSRRPPGCMCLMALEPPERNSGSTQERPQWPQDPRMKRVYKKPRQPLVAGQQGGSP